MLLVFTYNKHLPSQVSTKKVVVNDNLSFLTSDFLSEHRGEIQCLQQ